MRTWLIALAGALCVSNAGAQTANAPKTIEEVRAMVDVLARRGIHVELGADPAKAPDLSTHDPLLDPFLKTQAFRSMTLSPDGRHVAALMTNGINNAVALIDADTQATRIISQADWIPAGKYVAHMRNAIEVAWVGNDILAVNFNDSAWTIDLNGNGQKRLMARWLAQLREADGSPSEWAIVQRDADDEKSLSRFNVRTGQNWSVDIALPGHLVGWLLDSSGAVRVARLSDTAFWSDATKVTTWYRDTGEDEWRKIDERSILADPFSPLLIPKEPGHLAVQANNGGDRLAIWDFDVDTKRFGAQMAGSATEDIVAVQPGVDGSAFVDVVTDGLKPKRTWFDAPMARLQASIDASLPDHVNVLHPQSGDKMLVFSYSDVDPGHWYVFEPKAMKMSHLAAALPGVDPARMQPMRTLTYPAPDGLPIPAYLTLPGKPNGPVPTIVLIHGGPQARDRWAWDNDVQVFAAHGYAVFQPQFRGSTGFGKKFEEAGYGQWGQAMQDDISAGVHWLIDQKIAAEGHICIVGASYGGYAALWGLAHTPELYQCGVSTAGVSDIGRMLKEDSDTNDSPVGRELLRSKVADPKRMKVPMDSVSPLKHADAIVAPLLLVHGKLDKRVPIAEGQAMLAEMRRLHRDVEWMEFDDEGHGIGRVGDLELWYDAMLSLFKRTIGSGTPPFPAAPN